MDKDREAWLLEHLYYEWSMLNYTICKVRELSSGMEYNVHHESFAVHARLISMFLTNGDTGNYGAKDFVNGFRSRKTSEVIQLYNKIDPQVLHLSPKRVSANDRKLSSQGCVELFEWLKSEFDKFHSQMPEDVRRRWDDKNILNASVEMARPSATNQFQSVTSAFVPPIRGRIRPKS